MGSRCWTSKELASLAEMELQASLIVTLLLASVLAVPRKDCTLIRSSTNLGQCFSEPECEDVCSTVQERQCQTTSQQECNTVNEQKCETVNDNQCSTVSEQKCSTVNEQQCSTVMRQKCSTRQEQECSTVMKQQCSTRQ